MNKFKGVSDSEYEVMLRRTFKVLSTLVNYNVVVEMEPKIYDHYPYERARKGHNDAIKDILENKVSFLTHPTGTGKTAIFLTAVAESHLKTMVIAPRNKLQEQIASYASKIGVEIIPIYARAKHCPYAFEGYAPCTTKYRKHGKWYFELNGEIKEYPCPECPYEAIKRRILESWKSTTPAIVVANQGNFWMFRHLAEFVVIDEADETLSSVTSAVSAVVPRDSNTNDPELALEIIESRLLELKSAILDEMEGERDLDELRRLNNKLRVIETTLERKIPFFRKHLENLIVYSQDLRTGKIRLFVEMFFPDIVEVGQRLFPDVEKIVYVTATPPINTKLKRISTDMPFRARIIYAPLGILSVTNVVTRGNGHLFGIAARFISDTYVFITKLFGMTKAPIHVGNLDTHGKIILHKLEEMGYSTLLMEKGKQKQAIDEFFAGNYNFLGVVAAEYGYDWKDIPIQYILKVPYAYLGDPRIQAIQRHLGPLFNKWYQWDAMSRIIQAAGRNARDPKDYAVTLILDAQFSELWKEFRTNVPSWFRNRLLTILPTGEVIKGGISPEDGEVLLGKLSNVPIGKSSSKA